MQLLRSPLQTLAERKAYDTDLEIVPSSRNSHHHLVTASGHKLLVAQPEVTVTKQEQPVQDAPINLKRDSSPPPVQVCGNNRGKFVCNKCILHSIKIYRIVQKISIIFFGEIISAFL